MASNLYNTASVLVPKGAAGRASVIDAYRPAFNVLQSIGITRNDANGSFRNQQGLIEFAAANVPRFNWDEGDSCPKLLVEPQRTNLILRSEEFDSAAWNKVNSTITANAGISPDGTQNADKIIPTIDNLNHRVEQTTVISSRGWIEVFAKADGYNFLQLHDNTSGAYQNFNLLTGELGNGTAFDARITPAENGYYKCEYYRNGSFGVSRFSVIDTDAASLSPAFAGDGISGILLYGAQVEAGSYPTSYIKTEATTETRAADVISQTGLASLIGDSEGTLYVEAEKFNTGVAEYITLSDGTNSNRVQFTFGSSGQVIQSIVIGGVQETLITSNSNITSNNVIFKVAQGYKVNDFALYVDGVQIGTDNSNPTFSDGTLTDFKLALGNGGSPFYGKISVLAWWQARLSNSVLESLTSYETYEEMAATLDYTID